MSQQSDTRQLIARARDGDEASFRSLYRSFAPKARGTLRHMVGPHDLDDLVQDVFERVWKNLPRIRDTAAFSTWFYRITWNVAMDARHQAASVRARTVHTSIRWRLRSGWSKISLPQRLFATAATAAVFCLGIYWTWNSTVSNSLPQTPAATIASTTYLDALSDGEVMDFFSETISGVTESEALLAVYPSQHLETL